MSPFASLAALTPLVEGVLYLGPLLFFVVLLARGSRRRHDSDGDDERRD